MQGVVPDFQDLAGAFLMYRATGGERGVLILISSQLVYHELT
jgi:hypothetical protein